MPPRKTEEPIASRKVMTEFTKRQAQIEAETGKPIDAHTLLQLIYQDTALPLQMRKEAAIAATRFEKPALSSSDVVLRDKFDTMSDDELVDFIKSRTGRDRPGVKPS